MAYSLGKLRRSAVLMTHGPGSVVDFRSGDAAISAVISGLDSWDWDFKPEGLKNEQVIFEERLQKKLGVRGFRLPPVVNDDFFDFGNRKSDKAISAVRFPGWLQCPDCNNIGTADMWMEDPGKAGLYCASCSNKRSGRGDKAYVVPVRFVIACEGGHLDDFPWHWWVRHEEGCKNKEKKGFLKLESKGAGLGGLILTCPDCRASRSLEGIFGANALAGYSCSGRRPWLYGSYEDCDLTPRVMQRGASNLYFPVIESALSIPPWSDELREEIGTYWNDIINADDDDRVAFVKMLSRGSLKKTLESLHMTPEGLVKAIEHRKVLYERIIPEKLRDEEYLKFTSGINTAATGEPGEFEIRNESVPEMLQPYFSRIVRAVRLREVRALRGFTRIKPPGDEDDVNISPLSNTKKDWLPAIEVRGEGVFIEFNKDSLRNWENDNFVCEKAYDLNRKMGEEWSKKYPGTVPTKTITPRFLLIHTFAHALMRQLTLECGYSTASLRERLYICEDIPVSEGMAGFLIYTSSPDSDGTLGGLQRQGESKRIEPTIISAIKSMEWCSSDPLCITGMMAVPESFSIASCHGCCMAPETSCEEFNRFLDRGMLVGHHDNPDSGYFRGILRDL
ncbi:DUF1998 domain-containing protein [Methanoplanus sp. FWC-SCC4]|uniref:DUF1998 domain-containing protein n=2 Tax=Methanochimaera problematica TaxID=2609417 RepID=A0AA97I447_9EURY|nr:DUF1998 domain-containing protein [Methanoplanus sp. FWC-SCC4]